MKTHTQDKSHSPTAAIPNPDESALRMAAFLVIQDLLRVAAIAGPLPDREKGRLEKLLASWCGNRDKKRGAPKDDQKRALWLRGLDLRDTDKTKWSWAAITRRVDPKGYAADAARATDRMRQGIEAMRQEIKSARKRRASLFYGEPDVP